MKAGACLLAVGVAALTACAHPAPSGKPLPWHVDVTDPIGDAVRDSRIPVSPDLVHAAVTVAGGYAAFAVEFAPGTFNPQTTRVSIVLDTDQNGLTGIRQFDGMGADFALDLAAATGTAAVLQAASGAVPFQPAGQIPIVFLQDGMQVNVPLQMLGNASGAMTFRIRSYVLANPMPSITADTMPDMRLPPAQINDPEASASAGRPSGPSAIVVSVTPNPVAVMACNPPCIAINGMPYPFRALATLTIEDRTRVGAHVDFFTVAQQHNGRSYGTIMYGPDVLVRRAGTNYVGARSRLMVSFIINLNANDDGTHDRIETLDIQLTDEGGRRLTASTQFALF